MAAGYKPVWIISHESQNDLAKAIVKSCQEIQARTTKEWKDTRTIEYLDILKWNKFNDGFPNLFIDKVKTMAGKDIIIVTSFHSVEVIFEQISMLYEIPRYLAHSCTVILPYFPTGTMERIDLEGQVATAKTLATLLSNIPPTARGPTQIMLFDIHALQERFYFSSDVIPRLETAIPLIIQTIKHKMINMPVTIAFPDDGAEKRFSKQFPSDWPRVVCAKVRDGDNRIVRIKEGNPEGRHVVIVDDLVQSGNTLIEAGIILKNAKALTVSAFVTHAVFPQDTWKKFVKPDKTTGETLFTNFWITDSIPHARKIAQHPPFKLLSLAPVIANCLLGFDLRQ